LMRGEHTVDPSSNIGPTLRDRPVSDEVFPGPPPEVVRRSDASLGRLVSLPETIQAQFTEVEFDHSRLAHEWLTLSQAPPPAPPPLASPAQQPPAEPADAPEAAAEIPEEEAQVDETEWNSKGYQDPATGAWIPWHEDWDAPHDPSASSSTFLNPGGLMIFPADEIMRQGNDRGETARRRSARRESRQ